jgi:hypothetical protein
MEEFWLGVQKDLDIHIKNIDKFNQTMDQKNKELLTNLYKIANEIAMPIGDVIDQSSKEIEKVFNPFRI